MSYVTLTGPQTTTIIASFSVPANAAAGSLIAGNLTFSTFTPPQSVIVVPSTEVWSIIDIYTIGSVTPDAMLVMYINGRPQDTMPNLNSLNLNLLTRFKLAEAIKLAPTFTFNVAISLLAANGATAQTYYVYFSVVRAPFVAK